MPKSMSWEDAGPGEATGASLRESIGAKVMGLLGEPLALQRVQVRKLWADRYRVNVFVGPDSTSAVVAHSFFLVIDEAGDIVVASPSITRQY